MVNGFATLGINMEGNALLLWLIFVLSGWPLHWKRLAIGSMVAVLPTLWILLTQDLQAVPWPVAIFWPLLALGAAGVPARPGRVWARKWSLFWLMWMMYAGLSLTMSDWLLRFWPNISPLWGMSVVMPMAAWAGVQGWRRKASASAAFFPAQVQGRVRLVLSGRVLECACLWDSGNRLMDPVLHRPVVVLEIAQAVDWLPPELLAWSMGMLLGENALVPELWEKRVSMMSFHSLAGNGRLPVLPCEAAEGWWNGRWHALSPVAVGLTNHKISLDGSYRALISPRVLMLTPKEGVGA